METGGHTHGTSDSEIRFDHLGYTVDTKNVVVRLADSFFRQTLLTRIESETGLTMNARMRQRFCCARFPWKPLKEFVVLRNSFLAIRRRPWRPRVAFQYDYASGTADPNGQSSQTFDTLFGARRFEYNPTSIFGPFFRSNISTPGVRVGFLPRADTTVGLKYRAWYLAQSRDAWVGSGLQDPTGASGNFLGQDLELRISWQWVTDPKLIEFELGYDYFFKGSYVQRQAEIPGNPSARDSSYFYVQTEMRF